MTGHVIVAMSGGVDSAITAYLLKEAGWQVSAVHLELTPTAGLTAGGDHSGLEESCRRLDIPLHYLHLEQEFEEGVIEAFCREYDCGRTPNPCIGCNRLIKFGLLWQKARALGGDNLATGHYARVEERSGRFHLLKGIDSSKDQSYFLYVLTQEILSRVIFPLGGMHKTEVKALAAQKGLPAARQRESQDICFVAGNDLKAFLAARLQQTEGEIVDLNGQVVGRHQGLAYYTIGQRQGMRVSAAERLYVVRKNVTSNRLVIGGWDSLLRKDLTAGEVNWIGGQAPPVPLKIKARVRYRASEAPATLETIGEKVIIRFETPQRGIAAGQAVVFYQDAEVIGGGCIEENPA